MLKKLLKYDLKWIYKVVVVFYILSFIFSIIARCLFNFKNSLIFNFFAQFSLGFAIGMMISSLINNIMRAWVRFMNNLYKDESYLTHTLPVSKGTIYLSKFLAAIITTFTTTIVILICLTICYYSKENLNTLKSTLELAATAYNSKVISIIFMAFLVFFLEMAFIVLIGYVAIVLGYKSNNHKKAKSVFYGVTFYLVSQCITLLIIYTLGLFNTNIMSLFKSIGTVSTDAVKTVMYSGILIYLVYIFVYYIVGKKQLEKGVNVD